MTDQLMAELEPEVKRVLELLDAMNVRGLSALFTDDAQGVDEISRGWTRGRAALDAYFARLEGTVTDVRSQLSDLHTTTWDEVGLATFVLDQTYTMNGQEQSLSAPTSIVFRRQDDAWKVALVHSVPIPT
ncbi:MAG: nuclear transport factor 2 family protein [Pseudonocardiaceae bacterium]